MKGKVCRSCKVFVKGDKCHLCNKNAFSTSYNGLIAILDARRSKIAEKMGFTANDDYVIKVK